MNDTDFLSADQLCKRRRRQVVHAAVSADAAIARQLSMAREGSKILYDFGVLAYPIKVVKPTFDKCSASTNILRAGVAQSHSLLKKLDASIVRVQKAIDAGAQARDAIRERLVSEMQKERQRVFRVDFAASKRFQKRQGLCVVCQDEKKVTALQCTHTLCLDCCEKSAFASSQSGTKNEASCPLCREKFPVYEQKETKKRKRPASEV